MWWVRSLIIEINSNIFFKDSAELRGYKLDKKTGGETKFSILPTRTTSRDFGKCASYDLEPHKEEMFKINIYSPMDIMVTFHNRDMFSIHKELSAIYFYEGLALLVEYFIYCNNAVMVRISQHSTDHL